MKLVLKRFLTIAALTTLEAIRQPILLIITTSSVVIIGLMPVLLMHTMGETRKLVQDSALAFHFVCGLFLGGYAASAALGSEIRRGTLAMVLSKPVEREVFFLAKFAGVAGTLLLYSFTAVVATLLSVQMSDDVTGVTWNIGASLFAAVLLAYLIAGLINFYYRRPFVSNAFILLVVFLGLALLVTALDAPVAWPVLPASLLVSLATLVLAAIALALVTRLALVPTLAICTVIFLLGLMTDYLLGKASNSSPLAALAYNLIPNWENFWMADALVGEGRIPWVYVGQVLVYAIFYLLGTLSLGMLSFRNVETKA